MRYHEFILSVLFSLSSCSLQSNPVVLSNAKLALFYDWLAYDPESDSIMTIGKIKVVLLFPLAALSLCITLEDNFFQVHM